MYVPFLYFIKHLNIFSSHSFLPSSHSLIPPTSQPDDAGVYTCVATNAVGQDSHSVTLSVHTHPAFTELLGDVALNRGDRLLLACGVTGNPPPKISWAFNNNIIPGIWSWENGNSWDRIEYFKVIFASWFIYTRTDTPTMTHKQLPDAIYHILRFQYQSLEQVICSGARQQY